MDPEAQSLEEAKEPGTDGDAKGAGGGAVKDKKVKETNELLVVVGQESIIVEEESAKAAVEEAEVTEIAKGVVGTTSGQDIQFLSDGAVAYTGEYNSNDDGTACNLEPVSPQCSGVMLSRDGGDTFTRIGWQGTDGPGTDAMFGAFPSATT